MSKNTKIQVVIDSELQDIVPGYVASLKQDLVSLDEAIKKTQFEIIEGIGHRMKGVAISYGFPYLTDVGKALELAAKQKNIQLVQDSVIQIAHYLDSIEIVFQ